MKNNTQLVGMCLINCTKKKILLLMLFLLQSVSRFGGAAHFVVVQLVHLLNLVVAYEPVDGRTGR